MPKVTYANRNNDSEKVTKEFPKEENSMSFMENG